ncbi:hypothetical protein LBMAG53_33910 [Planctomycetota bacterium]|nr:hypothetical protein LBMAG53_33910 [Planctomycetota bacterium]
MSLHVGSSWSWPVPALLGLYLCAAALAAGDFSASVNVQLPWTDADGYAPAIVAIDPERDATLRLEARCGQDSGTLRVEVQDRRPQRVTVLVPGQEYSYVNLHATDDRGRSYDVSGSSSHQHRSLDLALVDPDETVKQKALHEFLVKALAGAALPGRHRYSSTAGYPEDRVDRFPVENLPDRWQGYPCWLVLWLTPAGDRALSAAQRQAIATWSLAGGGLIVSENSQVTAWSRLGARPILATAADPAPVAAAIRERLKDSPDDAPPVPGTDRVPVLAFVVIAVLFAVVVGPLNLWWVRRQGKRHLFLITTPIISAATCFGLILISILAEGIHVRRTVIQAVHLDQTAKRAIGWTGVSYFAGLSTGGLVLDGEDLVTAVLSDEERRQVGQLSLDWTDGLRADGPWIPSRTNRALRYIQARPDNRRLLIEPVGGGWRVTNGLGAAIDQLLWRDAAGKAWACTALADGASATLTQDGPARGLTRLPQLANQGRLSQGATLVRDAVAKEPFAYQAKLAAPLLPVPGPAGEDVAPVESWVFGIVAPATAGKS